MGNGILPNGRFGDEVNQSNDEFFAQMHRVCCAIDA